MTATATENQLENAPRRKTLFAISEEMLNLHANIEEILIATEGEITPEAEAIIDGWLNDNAKEFAVKLDDYAALVKELEAKAKARKDEAARLTGIAQTDQALADRLKARAKYAMELTGQTKVETNRFKLAVQNNGGVLPLVLNELTDWREFGKMHPTCVKAVPDNDGLRKAIEAGTDVSLAASLGERGTHLRIR